MKKLLSKTAYVDGVLLNYSHDWDAEGIITKTRLWYILKDTFYQLPHFEVKEPDKSGKLQVVKYLKGFRPNRGHAKGWVKMIERKNDVSRRFDVLVEKGLIDDTYILDSSRKMEVGSFAPQIIIAAEKESIERPVVTLFERLGVSYYISKGQSSIYGAKKMMKKIRSATDEPCILLVMSDYDKAGKSIQENISKHFDYPETHRILISPEQLSEDKLKRYFNEEEGERTYELDILNRHELWDMFLEYLPNNVADILTEAFDTNQRGVIQYEKITEVIDSQPEVMELEKQLSELRDELYDIYEARFIKADPIELSPITPRTIFDDEVTYTIKKWNIDSEEL